MCELYNIYIYIHVQIDHTIRTCLRHTHTVVQGVDFVCRGAKLAGEFAYLRGVSWMSKCLVHVTW
jgi:hypothetical protein